MERNHVKNRYLVMEPNHLNEDTQLIVERSTTPGAVLYVFCVLLAGVALLTIAGVAQSNSALVGSLIVNCGLIAAIVFTVRSIGNTMFPSARATDHEYRLHEVAWPNSFANAKFHLRSR